MRLRVRTLLALLLLTLIPGAAHAQSAPLSESMPELSVMGGQSRSIDLWVYDEETPVEQLTCIIVTPPQYGTVVFRYPESYPLNSYEVVYTATPGTYQGPDSFTFKARDPEGLESPVATVPISVTQNRPPVVGNSARTVDGLGGRITLVASDPDLQTLALTITTPPAHGMLQSGSFAHQPIRYTPASGYTGTDSFRFRVSDGTFTSTECTVTITVVANSTPVLRGQSFWIAADATTTGLVGGGAGWSPWTVWQRVRDLHAGSAADGQTYTYEVVTMPQHGTMTRFTNTVLPYDCSAFTFAYTPDPGFVGEDFFYARVFDGQLWSEPARYRLVVRKPRQPAGSLVLVVVESAMGVELAPEVARLRADLEAEGYTARVVPWSSDARSLWELFRSEYLRTDQCFVGALLLGEVPIPGRESGYRQLWEVPTLAPGAGHRLRHGHLDLADQGARGLPDAVRPGCQSLLSQRAVAAS